MLLFSSFFRKRLIPSFTFAPSQLWGLVCWDFSGHCQNPLANTTVTDFVTLFSSEIAKHLSLPPVKLHCSMLAEDAIKAAVKDYEAKKAKMGQKGEDSPREGCWSMKVSAVKYIELICFSVHDSPPLIAKDKCFCLWGEGLCVMFTNSGSAACALTLLRMVTTNFK